MVHDTLVAALTARADARLTTSCAARLAVRLTAQQIVDFGEGFGVHASPMAAVKIDMASIVPTQNDMRYAMALVRVISSAGIT